RTICDTVTIEIEGRIIAPVIAAPFDRPVEVARADIFHLIAVVDEGVAAHGIALGTGSKVNAYAAVLETVFGELVLVGIVNEDAFFRTEPRGFARLGFRLVVRRKAVFSFLNTRIQPAIYRLHTSDHTIA